MFPSRRNGSLLLGNQALIHHFEPSIAQFGKKLELIADFQAPLSGMSRKFLYWQPATNNQFDIYGASRFFYFDGRFRWEAIFGQRQ